MKDNNIALIELKRKYSKDELVSQMLKILKEKEFEIGVLKTTIQELEFKINPINKEINKTARNEAKNKDLITKNKALRKENIKLKKHNDFLMSKILAL